VKRLEDFSSMDELTRYLRDRARKGGLKGGPARAKKLIAAKRKEIAKKAAAASAKVRSAKAQAKRKGKS
jgi:hypothetical protein